MAALQVAPVGWGEYARTDLASDSTTTVLMTAGAPATFVPARTEVAGVGSSGHGRLALCSIDLLALYPLVLTLAWAAVVAGWR